MDHLIKNKAMIVFLLSKSTLWYNHSFEQVCLLIWIGFSSEQCGPLPSYLTIDIVIRIIRNYNPQVILINSLSERKLADSNPLFALMSHTVNMWHISVSAILRKEIVQSCDTQGTEGDCDIILIKNYYTLL